MTFVCVRAAWRSARSSGALTSASSSSTSYSSGSAAEVMKPCGLFMPKSKLDTLFSSPVRRAVGGAVLGRLVVRDEPEAIRAARALDAVEDEALLDARPVDDERERGRLPATPRVVGDHLDVVLRERFARSANLTDDVVGVFFLGVEHRQAPHLPVGVPRVRVV